MLPTTRASRTTPQIGDRKRPSQAQSRGGRLAKRRFGPSVTPLEQRLVLTTSTFTTLNVSAIALTYGQTEILTASVSTNPPSTTAPTGGSVTFLDGANALGSATLTNGAASIATSALTPGTHILSASYAGN